MSLNWYILKTKPKKEGHVRDQLQTVPFQVFLPKIWALSSEKPLFPTYLFIKTDFSDSLSHRLVRYTRGVSRILGDEEGPQPISETIVEILQQKTKNGSLIEQSLLFKEGDEVRVRRGILRDLTGIIEKNIPAQGRIKILFKWLHGNMRAVVKYTELEKVA